MPFAQGFTMRLIERKKSKKGLTKNWKVEDAKANYETALYENVKEAMTSPTADRPMDEMAATLLDALDEHIAAVVETNGEDAFGWLKPSAKTVVLEALRQAAAKGRVAGYLIGQEHMRNFAANQVAGLKGESLTGSWDMACEEIEATIRALPLTEDEPTS